MKLKKLIPFVVLLSTMAITQDNPNKIVDMTPTGEEGQTLAKLKERVLRARAEMNTLEVQFIAVQAEKQLKQLDINNAINNLNNEADNIKKNHKKDWGDNVDYQPENPKAEYGMFVQIPKNEPKKEEIKSGNENEIKKDEGQNKKEINKVKNNKPKK